MSSDRFYFHCALLDDSWWEKRVLLAQACSPSHEDEGSGYRVILRLCRNSDLQDSGVGVGSQSVGIRWLTFDFKDNPYSLWSIWDRQFCDVVRLCLIEVNYLNKYAFFFISIFYKWVIYLVVIIINILQHYQTPFKNLLPPLDNGITSFQDSLRSSLQPECAGKLVFCLCLPANPLCLWWLLNFFLGCPCSVYFET